MWMPHKQQSRTSIVEKCTFRANAAFLCKRTFVPLLFKKKIPPIQKQIQSCHARTYNESWDTWVMGYKIYPMTHSYVRTYQSVIESGEVAVFFLRLHNCSLTRVLWLIHLCMGVMAEFPRFENSFIFAWHDWFTSDSKKKLRKDTAAHFECAHIWMSHGILIHMCVTWLVHIRFKNEAAERHGCSLRFKKNWCEPVMSRIYEWVKGYIFPESASNDEDAERIQLLALTKKTNVDQPWHPYINEWSQHTSQWAIVKMQEEHTTTHVDQKINVHQSWHPYMHKWARYSICLSQRAMMKTQGECHYSRWVDQKK